MHMSAQVDKDISEALYEDQEYLKLSPAERIQVLERLNGMLHHKLYDVDSLHSTIYRTGGENA